MGALSFRDHQAGLRTLLYLQKTDPGGFADIYEAHSLRRHTLFISSEVFMVLSHLSVLRLNARSLLFAFLIGCMWGLTPASAQTITATVSGVVTDEAGAVVLNAKVTVTSGNTGQNKTATTDAEGR